MHRQLHRALACFSLGALGCGSSAAAGPSDGGAADTGASVLDDPDPVFTDAERATLATLHYDVAAPPADPSNRVADDPVARLFGQRLFFEPALSGQLIEPDNDGSSVTLGKVGEPGRVACAGCHLPESGFLDTRTRGKQVSLGAQWLLRRTPSLLEVAFAPLYNWDGLRDSIWRQAIGVMESDHEFNSGRLFVAEQMFRLHRADYETVFGAMPPLDDATRFPQLTPDQAGCVQKMTDHGPVSTCRGKPGDTADYDGMAPEDQRLVTEVTVNTAKALNAYVRQLRCGPGRFDAWLDGNASALSRAEQRGASLFAGKANCAGCHSGPLLTDGKFHDVGLRPQMVAVVIIDIDDHGASVGIAGALADPLNSRGAFSDGDRQKLPSAVTPDLDGAFRTPTLRCVGSRPSYMHTGQIRGLDDVVSFFNGGGDQGGYFGTNELMGLGLDARERADLAAFLGTFEGPGPDAALRSAP